MAKEGCSTAKISTGKTEDAFACPELVDFWKRPQLDCHIEHI
jgi:hypothetical protein